MQLCKTSVGRFLGSWTSQFHIITCPAVPDNAPTASWRLGIYSETDWKIPGSSLRTKFISLLKSDWFFPPPLFLSSEILPLLEQVQRGHTPNPFADLRTEDALPCCRSTKSNTKLFSRRIRLFWSRISALQMPLKLCTEPSAVKRIDVICSQPLLHKFPTANHSWRNIKVK